MIQINNASNAPIFEQIVLEIGKYVSLGIYKANDQLPSVRSLAIDLGINPNTVSKAYQECEARGLTYSIPGKGNFISEQSDNLDPLIKPIYQDLDTLINQLLTLGETEDDIIQHIKRRTHDKNS